MRRTKSPALTAAAAALTAAALAGCGAPQAPEPPQAPKPPQTEPAKERKPFEPEIAETAKTADPSRIEMPLDAYRLTSADEQVIAVARAVAAAAGYPRPVPPPLPKGVEFPEEAESRPTDEERGAFEGSGSTTPSGRPVPSGGCVEQGGRALEAGVEHSGTDVRLLASNASSLAMSDSRVRKTERVDWRACMKKAGRPYPAIVIAKNDERWRDRPAGTAAGAEEKAVAAADARCRRESGLIGLYLAIKKAHQERLLAKHGPAIEQAHAAALQRLERARALLGIG